MMSDLIFRLQVRDEARSGLKQGWRHVVGTPSVQFPSAQFADDAHGVVSISARVDVRKLLFLLE